MTKQGYTHLTLVVDRSGSMTAIREDSEGGINTLIKEQSEQPGDITVTLYQFDNAYEKVFGPTLAQDAPKYELRPRGTTALLDALNIAITETGEYLSAMPEDERPEHVLFCIVTDGQENASKEVTLEQIKNQITHQTNVYNWDFLFLGANIDSFSVGNSLGFRGGTNYVAKPKSTKSLYGSASRAIASTRLGKGLLTNNMPSRIDAEGNEVWDGSTESKS